MAPAAGSGTRGWTGPVSVLIGSQTVAAFGTALVQFAITWYLTLETQSGAVMALSIVFGILPQAVMSVAGGVLADRVSRRLLIVMSLTVVGVATAVLAVVMAAGYREHWLIFVVLAIRSIGAGVRAPAVSAALPQMVPGEQLLRVNGTFQTAQSAISLLSPIAAAAALGGTSITVILLIDVVMTGIATLLAIATPIPAPAAGHGFRWMSDLAEGVRYVRGHTFARWVFKMGALVILLGAAPAYLVPLRITRAFGDDVWMLGGSQIAVSLGMIAVGAMATLLGARLNLSAALAAAPFVFGAALLAMGSAQDIRVLFAAMFVAGAALTTANGLSGTLLQERVHKMYLGRIFGLYGMVLVGMPLGLAVFGPLADVVPVESLLFGAGVTLLVAAAAVMLRRGGRVALRQGLTALEPDPPIGEAASLEPTQERMG